MLVQHRCLSARLMRRSIEVFCDLAGDLSDCELGLSVLTRDLIRKKHHYRRPAFEVDDAGVIGNAGPVAGLVGHDVVAIEIQWNSPGAELLVVQHILHFSGVRRRRDGTGAVRFAIPEDCTRSHRRVQEHSLLHSDAANTSQRDDCRRKAIDRDQYVRGTSLMLPIVTREIVLVQNFIEELKRLVPEGDGGSAVPS